MLDEGCRDLKAGKAIEYMWRKRLCSPGSLARVGSIGIPSSPVTLQNGMSILSCFNTIIIILLSATWAVALVCMHMRHLLLNIELNIIMSLLC